MSVVAVSLSLSPPPPIFFLHDNVDALIQGADPTLSCVSLLMLDSADYWN